MIKVTTKGTGKASEKLKKALEQFISDKFVTVGIHEEEGIHDGGITNAQLGALHHYGSDEAGVPARPWLDIGVAQGNEEYISIVEEEASKDDGDLEMALEKIGLIAAGRAREFMINLSTPPNSQDTIDAKGSSNPLIDTGALMQSVHHKVSDTEPEEG